MIEKEEVLLPTLTDAESNYYQIHREVKKFAKEFLKADKRDVNRISMIAPGLLHNASKLYRLSCQVMREQRKET